MRSAALALAFLLAAFATRSIAQAPPALNVVARSASIIPPLADRVGVFVEHTGRDAAGRAFVAGLKAALKSSKRFALAENERSAGIIVIVVSVSPTPAATGVASAVSLAYVANNEWRSLLGSAARFVGRDRANEMGRQTVDELTAILGAYETPATH